MRAGARRPGCAMHSPRRTRPYQMAAILLSIYAGGPLDTVTRSYNETHTRFGSLGMAWPGQQSETKRTTNNEILQCGEPAALFAVDDEKSLFFHPLPLSLCSSQDYRSKYENNHADRRSSPVAGATCYLAGSISSGRPSTLSAATEQKKGSASHCEMARSRRLPCCKGTSRHMHAQFVCSTAGLTRPFLLSR